MAIKQKTIGLIGKAFQGETQPMAGNGVVDGGSGRGDIVIDYATFLLRHDELLSSGLFDPSGLSGQAPASIANDLVGLRLIDGPGVKGGRGKGGSTFSLHQSDHLDPISTGDGADSISASTGHGRISTGNGDDTIRTAGWSGTIDGGAGTDLWMVDFAERTSSSFLTFDGRTGAGWTGSKEGQAYSYGRVSASNMERIDVRFGAGDDTVKLTATDASVATGEGNDMIWLYQPGRSTIGAGAGTDTLIADLSGNAPSAGAGVYLFDRGEGGWSGLVGSAHIGSVERVTVNLTSSDDFARLDCAPLLQGGRVSLNAGDGLDTLELDFSAYSRVTFRPDNTGTVRMAGAVFSGFEAFSVIGSAGNDVLKGSAGNDILRGDAGNDQLYATTGADQLIGGQGNDTYFMGDSTTSTMIEHADEGIDTVYAMGSYALSDNVERLFITGSASAEVVGNATDNLLVGNVGDDFIYGGDGKDNLQGGAGNDELAGVRGADILIGGACSDTFTFSTLETSAERDIVKDFTPGEDHMLLYSAVFAALEPAANDPAARAALLAIGTTATTADQHLVYNPRTGSLFYDADGGGGQQQLMIAVLTNKPTLTIDNFIIG